MQTNLPGSTDRVILFVHIHSFVSACKVSVEIRGLMTWCVAVTPKIYQQNKVSMYFWGSGEEKNIWDPPKRCRVVKSYLIRLTELPPFSSLQKASVQKHLVFNPAAFSAPSTLSTIPEPPQLSAASAVVKATITSATSAAAVPASELPGLHETAASLVSSFTSLCQSPTAANPSKQLSFLATSMLQAHLSEYFDYAGLTLSHEGSMG